MKKIYTLLFALMMTGLGFGQTSPGDIAFTAFNADGDDDFAIVALVDLPANTEIYFTDNEPATATTLTTGEGTILWDTGASLISAGTIVVFTDTDSSGNANFGASTGTLTYQSGSLNLAGGGDALYAFAGTSSTAVTGWLAGIQNEAGNQGAGFGSTGLTVGTTFINFFTSGSPDGGAYNGPRSGETSFSDYLTELGDNTNWTIETSNGENILPISTTAFTITGGTPDTSIQFSTTSASVTEDSGTYDLVIEIANEDAVATTFDVVLTSGDAADIDSYTTQSETFPGSSTTDITVTVTITDDAIVEGDEVFTFEIQNVAGGNNAAVGTNNSFNLTILANDAPPPTDGWQITAEDTSFVIDFDTTVSGVNEGTFDASGFTTSPASGQLDSDAWESTGMSDGALSYGGSETSGDYARGTSSGGETSGGFYAFDTGAGNSTLGFQGTGSDFTPGTITLRAQNQTGNTVTAADLAYLIYVYNDQGRGNSFNFSYSTDDVSYTAVGALDFTSEEIADGVPAWTSTSRSTIISGLSIADGDYLYLRWSSNDDIGSGSRDEIALDDIDLTFNPAATTYTFNGSWTPSDPNGAASALDDIVIASGDAVINTNTTCNSVTVNAGAGLTVNSGISLTTTAGVALESTSTSYSSLILDGTIDGAGAITYDRHVNINGSGTTGSNDLISAPLTGQAFNVFEDANPNILSDNEVTPSFHLFGPFDKTTGEYVVYADSETATLDPGIGYRAASNDNSTFTFTGTANNGNINVGILNSGPQEEEWNLIGNPYPSYLNVQDFLNHEVSPGVTNLSLFNAGTAAIYGYDGDALNGWTIYNLATTTASTVMAPGQGFFVSSANASATLGFTPAMRSTGTSDDFIVGRQGELTYMTLNMSTDSDSYSTDVYFNDNASLGFDFGFDAEFFGTPPAFSLYTLLVEDDAGNAITLQAVNTTDLGNTTIPLGVNANQGEQLTFTISTLELPSTTEVYLEDTVENTSTLLTEADYILTPSTALSGTGRFFLRFFDSTFLSTPENTMNNLSISALDSSNEILVSGQLLENTVFDLYDIQGRKVLSVQLDNSSLSNRIDVSSVSGGVYVAQVRNNEQQKSQKVIIN